jgi:2-polyprenyl-3-methyl-5-hydroxy-6-metoxy-1,4-benzoquinol methylase
VAATGGCYIFAAPRMDTQQWRNEQRKRREAVRGQQLNPGPNGRHTDEIELPSASLLPPDLLSAPIVSGRGAPGRVVVAVKKLLRRLLAPLALEPQTRFNEAVVETLIEQRSALVALAERPVSAGAATVPGAPMPIDYLGFEERFRGSKEEIEDRQREYLDYFFERGEVLDIGCGRGELLWMFQERGIPARGVDLDEDMVVRCREQGLMADCADAIEFLERQPDGAFGGVFMSQVVEHLSTDYLVALLDAIARKTSEGAVLIVETINPESLPVAMRWYWLDPTHVRLVHPETLQYFIEQAGFSIKTVQFRRPVPEQERFPTLELPGVAAAELASFNEAVEGLNARVFGPLDYFVVGQSDA